MDEAPEKIVLLPCPTYGWEYPDRVKYPVPEGVAYEFTRTDLYEAAIAERDALQEEVGRLREAQIDHSLSQEPPEGLSPYGKGYK